MDPARLSSTTQITPASPRHTSPPPSRSLNRTPSTKASRQHLIFQEESKKLQRNLICKRRSPTSVSNASLPASKISKSKNSTMSISVTPSTPSKVFSAMSEPTMVVPLCPSSQQGQRDSGHPAQTGAADGNISSAKHKVG